MTEVTPICQFGTKAISFSLNGVDENTYNLDQIKGKNGTLIMFICNHCPYVKGVIDRLVLDTINLQKKGIGCAAIMSNDVENYPEDSFENMKKFSKENNFTFPYLYDETQEIAKAYGTDFKTEAKGVWVGIKKTPKQLGKATWKYPITTGIVSGVALGLALPSGKKKKKKKV